MTPADEARYLRHLADEIGSDHRLNLPARLVTSAVLIGRATRIDAAAKAARKGIGMGRATRGNRATRGRIETSEAAPDLTPEPPLTPRVDRSTIVNDTPCGTCRNTPRPGSYCADCGRY